MGDTRTHTRHAQAHSPTHTRKRSAAYLNDLRWPFDVRFPRHTTYRCGGNARVPGAHKLDAIASFLLYHVSNGIPLPFSNCALKTPSNRHLDRLLRVLPCTLTAVAFISLYVPSTNNSVNLPSDSACRLYYGARARTGAARARSTALRSSLTRSTPSEGSRAAVQDASDCLIPGFHVSVCSWYNRSPWLNPRCSAFLVKLRMRHYSFHPTRRLFFRQDDFLLLQQIQTRLPIPLTKYSEGACHFASLTHNYAVPGSILYSSLPAGVLHLARVVQSRENFQPGPCTYVFSHISSLQINVSSISTDSLIRNTSRYEKESWQNIVLEILPRQPDIVSLS